MRNADFRKNRSASLAKLDTGCRDTLVNPQYKK